MCFSLNRAVNLGIISLAGENKMALTTQDQEPNSDLESKVLISQSLRMNLTDKGG